MEFLIYLTTGIVIGITTLLLLPKFINYLPDIDSTKIKNPEIFEKKNFRENFKNMNLVNNFENEIKTNISEKQKKELRDIVENFENDDFLEIKIFFFKFFFFLVFFLILCFLLTGTLNPVLFWRKFCDEGLIYGNAFLGYLGDMGDQEL